MPVGSALSGLRVVEHAGFIPGPYCAKLLADSGAEIIKIEEPGIGDSSRRFGPFPGDRPRPESSGLFQYLNGGKLGITLDCRDPEGLDILKRLLKDADIYIGDRNRSEMAELRLGYEDLKPLNPRLVVLSVTPFGETGPCCEWEGSDLIACQMSGVSYTTPTVVDDPPSQPPLRPGGRQTDYLAGVTGAVAVMFAILARGKTGRGQHIDVSQQAAAATFLHQEIPPYTHDPGGFYQIHMAKRKRSGWGPVGYLPCKDGYIAMGCREEYQWRVFLGEVFGPNWGDKKELSEVLPDFSKFDLWVIINNWARIRPMIVEWCMRHSRDEIFNLARQKGLPIAPCNDPSDLLKSEQLKSRDYFVEATVGESRVTMPGAPFRLNEYQSRAKGRAPTMGEHNREVFCGRLGLTEEDLARLKKRKVI